MIKRNPAKNFIGKPYAGKPHVRFEEGVGKVILPSPLYSTVKTLKLTTKDSKVCTKVTKYLFLCKHQTYAFKRFNKSINFFGRIIKSK